MDACPLVLNVPHVNLRAQKTWKTHLSSKTARHRNIYIPEPDARTRPGGSQSGDVGRRCRRLGHVPRDSATKAQPGLRILVREENLSGVPAHQSMGLIHKPSFCPFESHSLIIEKKYFAKSKAIWNFFLLSPFFYAIGNFFSPWTTRPPPSPRVLRTSGAAALLDRVVLRIWRGRTAAEPV